MRFQVVTAFLISAVAAAPMFAQGQSPRPQPSISKGTSTAQAVDLQYVVGNLEKAQQNNRQHYRAYTMVRDYKLFSSGNRAEQSDVVAQISFVPPNRKTFTIDKVIGASRGEKVVRKILEHEAKTTAEDHGASELNRENYDFVYLGMAAVDGHPCYLLQLQPKHKREDLVAGRAWVDTRNYLPRLIDGDLSKNPSWWLKRVHLTLSFADIDGMWLQTGTRAVADVRVFGEHILTAHELNYQSGQAEARNRAPAGKIRSVRRPDLVGEGIFTH
ncbi:MAG TPA: hypothetical protein VKT29_04970 [Terriglobales bacterium]|nr:hypothetical protein [Terriglobales bacterium]